MRINKNVSSKTSKKFEKCDNEIVKKKGKFLSKFDFITLVYYSIKTTTRES